MIQRPFVIGIVALAIVGCFDSNWGATKRAQTNNAAHAMPAALTVDDGDHSMVHVQGRRVRVWVTPTFASQVVEHQRQITSTLEDSSKILAPLGVRLDIATFNRWEDAGPEDDLQALVAALRAKDPGDDVDWVVAFVGSIPKVTNSFHDLGMADTPGKFLVLRSPGSLDETQAIDKSFDELEENDRVRLSVARKRHRATSVCLHELAHTLGAIHEADERSLMNARFDSKMSGFSVGALNVVRVMLAHRDEPHTPSQAHVVADELFAVFEGPLATTWIPSERDAMVARLRAANAPAPAARAAPTVAPVATQAPSVADAPELRADERAIYKHAVELRDTGDVEGSWKAASALFKSHPQVYAVQDLRCQLAMKRVGWPGAQADCDALLKVTRKR